MGNLLRRPQKSQESSLTQELEVDGMQSKEQIGIEDLYQVCDIYLKENPKESIFDLEELATTFSEQFFSSNRFSLNYIEFDRSFTESILERF